MRPITGSILLVAFTRASFDNTTAISHFYDTQTVGYPSHHHQCLPASKVTWIIEVDLLHKKVRVHKNSDCPRAR
ncbi:hypothetical protein FFLO_05461 [Filobasidium floriforme]|uniref:Uncharacterized protein n=1 Tax=Filobasidium floriforme TaxID=5210 RepID=A0A8K0JGX8_9TREE|nr:hypothetical protein FFLO_05461 [Filobasidium floriforme]